MKVISVRQVRSVNFFLPNGIRASRPLFRAGVYLQTPRVKGGGFYYKLVTNYGESCFSEKKARRIAQQSGYQYAKCVRHGYNVPNEDLWFVKENI
jgi:hypothetical protein